ncbi:MAG: zinc ribbon domain-containing protein [Acidobacteriia bacterium]|nr:zinc ribbon domain-containing protein [Terriglobia bacterium]
MFCHSCGTQVGADLQFCPNCGQPLAAPNPFSSPAPVMWTPPVGVRATPGRWVGAGWEMVKADIGNYILMALVFLALISVVPVIIQGPLMAGFHIYCMKRILNRPAEFADLFKGFNFFVPALVASLLIGLFSFAGTLLCIIPGLVVAAMYNFTYLFIVDKRMDFWPAMQASHAVVKNDYFGFTMFLLLTALVNLLGLVCCIVGVLVTVPLTFAAITVAYKEIVGFDPRTETAL